MKQPGTIRIKDLQINSHLTVDHDIINLNGGIILKKDQKVTIRELMKNGGFYSKGTGGWIPEEITAVKLFSIKGIWFMGCFKETRS